MVIPVRQEPAHITRIHVDIESLHEKSVLDSQSSLISSRDDAKSRPVPP